MRHFGPGGFGGGHMLFGFLGFIGTLVLLSLITLLVVFLVKRAKGQNPAGFASHPHRPPVPPMPPAVQILDERLARGEIEVEDYMTRRAALLGGNPVQNEWKPQPPPADPSSTEETKVDPAG